jgi:hypothetical protein
VFAFPSAPIDTPTLSPFPTLPLARSLGDNEIGAEGVTALAAVLKETQITNLECAAAPECSLSCQRPLTLLLCHANSLASNAFCGYYEDDDGEIQGTYTAEGITKLSQGLKGSAVTSLECAVAPRVSCQRPLTLPIPVLAACPRTISAASTKIMVVISRVPTPRRASPSCARGSRGAP